MFHTPLKLAEESIEINSPTNKDTGKAGPSPTFVTPPQNARRSIGESEKADPVPCTSKGHSHSPGKTASVPLPSAPRKTKPIKISTEGVVESREKRRISVDTAGDAPKPGPRSAAESVGTIDRVSAARTLLRKAKASLGESRNLRTDIKTAIIQAVDGLYQLVLEGASITPANTSTAGPENKKKNQSSGLKGDGNMEQTGLSVELKNMIEKQGIKIDNAAKEIKILRDTVSNFHAEMAEKTYATAASAPRIPQPPKRGVLHSLVVAPTDETETSEEVLNRIRGAVNAKDGWVTVERVRKIKNQKVIMACKTEEQRERVKERLKAAGDHLRFEEVQNQDPMLVLMNVMTYLNDGDVIAALRNQNGEVFQGLKEGEDRVEFKFRRKARNPHTTHVVLKVSPAIYNRALALGSVHVDLQRVKVEDQSPLVQCSMCLGYGHGRRHCKETLPKCSHCGGLHLKDKCADWLAGVAPSCCNCGAAGFDAVNHGAFSQECPVRRKWDALARAKIAYS